jgi:hypothetical protein
MDQSLYEFILQNVAPSSFSVAKLAEHVFNKKYIVHIIGRSPYWFEREENGTLKRIDNVVIRNRLSNDFPDIIRKVREEFRKDLHNNSEYAKMEAIANNSQSIEALKLTLVSLAEKRRALREINRIDESREIDQQIKDTEAGIEYLTTKQNLQRSDIKDRKYAELVNIEDKLYNRNFKNDVIKDLEDILYEPHD